MKRLKMLSNRKSLWVCSTIQVLKYLLVNRILDSLKYIEGTFFQSVITSSQSGFAFGGRDVHSGSDLVITGMTRTERFSLSTELGWLLWGKESLTAFDTFVENYKNENIRQNRQKIEEKHYWIPFRSVRYLMRAKTHNSPWMLKRTNSYGRKHHSADCPAERDSSLKFVQKY